MITISNDKVIAKFSEKGAELQSLKFQEREYLWQADAAYWAKHSPVLFPFVGELKDGKYIFEDNEYKMSRHGFAREKFFEAVQTSPTSVTFTLRSDEETIAVYPFRFIFKVEYAIEETKLFCTFHVTNVDTKTMYFSVGGHPAFNVPLKNNLEYSDYFLKFENDNILNRYLLHDGLTVNDTEQINLPENKLPLQKSLFYTDAIVLKDMKSTSIELVTDKDIHGLKFNFNHFPYFGIWAAKNAPFVCLEPWWGIADSIYHDHQLIHKEGINLLAASDNWQRTWSVELF